MKARPTLAAALLIAASASAASGAGYSGNWPVTVSRSQSTNGTYCVTLKDNGSHSGEATVVFEGNGELFGSFFLINHDLAMTFPVPALGQNYGLVFVAHAGSGTIGSGLMDYVQGGEPGDAGAVAVGQKNSC
jgi:hypothetical protein